MISRAISPLCDEEMKCHGAGKFDAQALSGMPPSATMPVAAKRQRRPSQLRPLLAVREILLVVDFTSPSHAALQTVLLLAQKCHAKLTLLHVMESAHAALDAVGGTIEGLHEGAQGKMNQLLERVKATRLSGRGVLSDGILSDAILEGVSFRRPDLLVIGTDSLYGGGHFGFGSAVEAVLRKASCPVMILGPAFAQRDASKNAGGPVVFATDFNLSTTDAIRQAASYSEIFGTQLCCLHILPRGAKGTEWDHIVPEIMTGALQHIAEQAPVLRQEIRCDVGYGSDVSYAIVDYAKQHKAQLIVLGGRRSSMFSAELSAHIACRVIAEAPCPVLTIACDVHGTAF